MGGFTGHPRPPASAVWPYIQAAAVVLACTSVAALMARNFAPSNLVMIYLLGVALVATSQGRWPSILASVLSVAAFDFFFVEPHLTFVVADTQYLFTFGVMLAVALLISTLADRVLQQAEAAHVRERRTESLYALSRDLLAARDVAGILAAAVQHLEDASRAPVAIFLAVPGGGIAQEAGHGVLNQEELPIVRGVFRLGQKAGPGSQALPGARGLYVPLAATHGTHGVVVIQPASAGDVPSRDQLDLVEAMIRQVALALEHAQLAEQARSASVQIESERLRNALLSSISHDLRTPLAAIQGAASTLAASKLPAQTGVELALSISAEADRLNRLVGNLLDVTRLEAGAVSARKDWYPIEEVVGAALARVERQLGGRPVEIVLEPDVPLVPLDPVLIEQVLVNLVENAVKYGPPDGPITLRARVTGSEVLIGVADRGPGLPPGSESRLFEKFYRAPAAAAQPGAGLGLAICRGMVAAHGGRIWAANRDGGGAEFTIALPLPASPPIVPVESNAAAS